MARKSRGAALYELLYKDKGKHTAPDGSIKLPGWWDKALAKPPKPSEAPESAEQAAPPEAASDAAAVAPPVRAAAAPSGVSQPPAGLSGLPRPFGPQGQSQRPSFAPGLVAGRWLEVSHGRIRLNITAFSGLTAGLAAIAVLLAVFIGGLKVGHKRAAAGPRQAAPPPAVQPDKDRDKLPKETKKEAVKPVTPPAGAVDESPMVEGRTYVIVATTVDGSMANNLKKYLSGKGLQVLVEPLGQYQVVRSAQSWHLVTNFQDERDARPEDLPKLKEIGQLIEQLKKALADSVAERRGLVTYRPEDKKTHPYSYTRPRKPQD